MSALGLDTEKVPADSSSAFKLTSLIPAICVVAILAIIGIALIIHRRRVALRGERHLEQAATQSKSPAAFHIEWPKSSKSFSSPAEANREIAIAESSPGTPFATFLTQSEEPLTSREERLAQLEEGLFGHTDRKPKVAREASAPPALPSHGQNMEAADLEQRRAAITTMSTPTRSRSSSLVRKGAPKPITIPTIAIRKATTPHPEALPLPISPTIESPPCPVSASMRNPPMPPLRASETSDTSG